jgi:hypothetical protein
VKLAIAAAAYNGLRAKHHRFPENGMGNIATGDTRSDHGRWWGWPRRVGVLAVTAGLVLQTAACSGSPSSTGSGSSNAGESAHTQMVAFSHCVRSRGVPDFPDPLPGQVIEKFPSWHQLQVSSSQLQAAENACQHLLPNGGSGPNQAEMQQELGGLRRFSECLRAHGMPSWPDPTAGSEGPFFNLFNYHGVGFGSPQGQAARRQCQHQLPLHQAQTGLPVEQW